MFFTDAEVSDWKTASTSDTDRYAKYFRSMLEQGFQLAPSQFEATFVGLAHSDEDIDAAIAAAAVALKSL
jgi:glutamate-1-semialdehyde 2,1-aminomutase